jgi:hypothetical protein
MLHRLVDGTAGRATASVPQANCRSSRNFSVFLGGSDATRGEAFRARQSSRYARRMRSGVWLALLGLTLPLGSCSGGYPLPPTRCDEWCDVTRGATCEEYYDPAGCVAECEQADVDTEICSAQFDAILSCFRRNRNAIVQRCVYDDVPDDCESEEQALMICAALYDDSGG